jgi:hypothetical protein
MLRALHNRFGDIKRPQSSLIKYLFPLNILLLKHCYICQIWGVDQLYSLITVQTKSVKLKNRQYNRLYYYTPLLIQSKSSDWQIYAHLIPFVHRTHKATVNKTYKIRIWLTFQGPRIAFMSCLLYFNLGYTHSLATSFSSTQKNILKISVLCVQYLNKFIFSVSKCNYQIILV